LGAVEHRRVAIACQGGGSHTAFTAGVLTRLFDEALSGHEVVGISGTSGGAVCALLAWYALREGDPASAGRLLEEFWAENSATTPWEQFLNASIMFAGDLQQFMTIPVVSPYENLFADAGAEEFVRLLARRVDFDRLEPRAGDGRPVLLIGAVDVLSGEFRAFDSRRDRITAETILASAAIPTLFRAVHLDGGIYWDGLFSQNPPVRELLDVSPDEIWVIQINPTERDTEPRTALDIADRRNELAGNLSLYQELHFIEKIDELLEAGILASDARYKSVMVRIIELSPSRLPRSLSARSKMNRDPTFIRDLIDHGRTQANEFLTGLAFERAWRAGDRGAMLSFFDDDVEFVSTPPFPPSGPARGVDHLAAFLDRHLPTLLLDATRKQVAREAVTWSVKTRSPRRGDHIRGEARIGLRAGKIATLRLGPATRATHR